MGKIAMDVVDREGHEFHAVIHYEENEFGVRWRAELWDSGQLMDETSGRAANFDSMRIQIPEAVKARVFNHARRNGR